MSIFSAIKNAIFGHEAAAATPASAPARPTATPSAAPSAPAPQAVPAQSVDVDAVMEQYVKRSGQKLNWRTSIVDLLKALGIDSSLANRKALAEELGFDGDNSDSAAMNVWLHKRVMMKLAENGGKIPDSILHA